MRSSLGPAMLGSSGVTTMNALELRVLRGVKSELVQQVWRMISSEIPLLAGPPLCGPVYSQHLYHSSRFIEQLYVPAIAKYDF